MFSKKKEGLLILDFRNMGIDCKVNANVLETFENVKSKKLCRFQTVLIS